MGICYTTQSLAQNAQEDLEINAEKIILDDKDNEGQTTIEIKNGKLYVDGKKVSDLDKNTKLKIVKKNTIAENHNFQLDLEGMDSPFRPTPKSYGITSRKAMLGVRTQDAKPGAEVKEIVKGSAAEKAGLQEGDIIVAVDGENIETSQDLAKTIGSYDKGDEVKIQIERNGKADNLMAQLDAPKQEKIPFNKMPGTGKFSLPFQNLENLFDMPNGNFSVFSSSSTPKLGLEIEESENGLEVVSVKENSAAADAGLKAGDEIKTIEGEEVNSINTLSQEIMKNKDNKKMYIGVKRGGAIKSLPVFLPRAKKRAQF